MTYGQSLIALREHRRLTQKQACKLAGMTPAQLSHIEHDGQCSFNMMKRIAESYGYIVEVRYKDPSPETDVKWWLQLTSFRVQAGKTLDEVAKHLNTVKSVIIEYETAQRIPDIATLTKMLKFYRYKITIEPEAKDVS